MGADFHSLVADPMAPGGLFVGGHETVSGSRDGGRSWAPVDSLDRSDAMGWAFTGDAVYVSGHPGISRSNDGATTFGRANDGLPDTDVHAFGAGASTLFAAGPALGVVASTDGGQTWSGRTSGAGQSYFGRILVGPDDDQHLVAADARAGVVESTDGGRTWRRLSGPPSAVWVSRNGGSLYASGPRGAARSTDGGATWENLTLPEGATLVEAHPSDPGILYTGIHDGEAVRVLVSRDSGARWSPP
ncbi:MAG: WD40/YVTN/BNR-like repeat-containing protein [Acidimicrobiales bacterium]